MTLSYFFQRYATLNNPLFYLSPYGNGPQTLKFFEDQFGITDPRDVVALMGAHTLGKLDQRNSFFKYFWNRGEQSYFNNQYYKTIADKYDHAIQYVDNASDGFVLIGQKLFIFLIFPPFS